MATAEKKNALDLIDDAIAELEARLNLKPGETPPSFSKKSQQQQPTTTNNKKKKPKQQAKKKQAPASSSNDDLPNICKLEFKVGEITKVWVHQKADKLYCEEIDVGEEDGPRQIASGLRPHFSLDEMMGQRLLVVTNLKPKNLVGFKSHGMVLCAAKQQQDDDDDDKEIVEFVEPPPAAAIGEVVTFEGLPPPQPVSGAQVEKKKIFQACMADMTTTDDCVAVWKGHKFMTSGGPCKVKSITGGVLR